MQELDALRRAVIAEPEDDTVRLAFADCLEDLGEVRRAAFIRVSIEEARLEEGREKYDLLKQMTELAPTHMDFDPWEVSTDKTPATNELMAGKCVPFRLVAYYPLMLLSIVVAIARKAAADWGCRSLRASLPPTVGVWR